MDLPVTYARNNFLGIKKRLKVGKDNNLAKLNSINVSITLQILFESLVKAIQRGDRLLDF